MGLKNYGFCSEDCKTVDVSEGGEDNETGGEDGGTKPLCSTVSGPVTGSLCVFPFIWGGQTFTECAEWNYGGENQGKLWCSTKYEGFCFPCTLCF